MMRRCACDLVALALCALPQLAWAERSAESYRGELMDRIEQGQIAAAVELAEDATRRYPGDARLHYLHGVCLHAVLELDRAIAALERARQHDPGDAEVVSELALAYATVGALDQAMSVIATAQKIAFRDELAALADSLAVEQRIRAGVQPVLPPGSPEAMVDALLGRVERGELAAVLGEGIADELAAALIAATPGDDSASSGRARARLTTCLAAAWASELGQPGYEYQGLLVAEPARDPGQPAATSELAVPVTVLFSRRLVLDPDGDPDQQHSDPLLERYAQVARDLPAEQRAAFAGRVARFPASLHVPVTVVLAPAGQDGASPGEYRVRDVAFGDPPIRLSSLAGEMQSCVRTLRRSFLPERPGVRAGDDEHAPGSAGLAGGRSDATGDRKTDRRGEALAIAWEIVRFLGLIALLSAVIFALRRGVARLRGVDRA